MTNDKITATSDDKRNITLSGFIFISDKLPDDFEVCLLVETNGHLSAGCWDTGLKHTKDGKPGVFHQSRGGILEIKDILAWLPIEETAIDIDKKCWKNKTPMF